MTLRRTLLSVMMLIAAATSASAAEIPDASDARAGMCVDYSGVAYGFCVALCEARQCDAQPADDQRCAVLRRGFARATGGLTPPC